MLFQHGLFQVCLKAFHACFRNQLELLHNRLFLLFSFVEQRYGAASITVTGITHHFQRKLESYRFFFLRFLWSLVTPPRLIVHYYINYSLISMSTPDGKSKRINESTVCGVGLTMSIRRLCVRISNCSRESLYL